ncbi:gp029 [Rhodococcus phage ReqiPepy6]|uniref:Gp029 n=1 Tax=Rhodococcus phage ReqiPepy6 TaxID=691965 RepID=D4P7E0_9CAUD|nr:gp029 [Rhodococcus phage ReqiPepy6]ADD80920.1 gp029 [Rhodococcus phage ReqiPepy6]
MLQLDVVIKEDFNDDTQEFIITTWPLRLEHSLVSLSKWESKYEKPFISSDKSESEILDYVLMMDLSDETPPEVYQNISNEQFLQINEHINAKMTATWFSDKKKKKVQHQIVTSELIYYWMTSYEIPWVAETWHLNRLFTLIEVFNAERSTTQKTNKPTRSEAESAAAQRRALNEQRRKELGTSG